MSDDLARARQRHQTLIGAGALVVGALMAWGATGISSEAGYAGVGPDFLPKVVSAALVACGALLVWEARRSGWRAVEPPSGAERGSWVSLAWVAAGVAVNALLIERIGFIASCTLCYVLAVRGLRHSEGVVGRGLRGGVLDVVTGFLIAAPAFWLFTKLLGINLPGLTDTGWL